MRGALTASIPSSRSRDLAQDAPVKFAYAAPPYLGCSRKHYGHQHAEADLYDTLEGHRALIERLQAEFPDGWTLSCTSGNLRDILPMCPPRARVAAWVKPFASFKVNVNPAYAWEPVIFMGGRKRGRDCATLRDWVAANITLKRGVSGAKPKEFCFWLFDLLGMEPEDEFHDLFPGSGSVAKAHEAWKQIRPLLTA